MSAARGAIRAVDDVSSACPGGERCRTLRKNILHATTGVADLPEGQACGT